MKEDNQAEMRGFQPCLLLLRGKGNVVRFFAWWSPYPGKKRHNHPFTLLWWMQCWALWKPNWTSDWTAALTHLRINVQLWLWATFYHFKVQDIDKTLALQMAMMKKDFLVCYFLQCCSRWISKLEKQMIQYGPVGTLFGLFDLFFPKRT